jgi:putative spermidine/putrescine transport system ATP-binding protein
MEAAVKLSIRDVGKTYGPVTALAGASLGLRQGEFLTLLGPSGSGKTTLLMIVAGLVQPTSGEVWIDGKLATYAPPDKRDIGVVFQNYALFPHLTIQENIAFPLRMRRLPEAQISAEVGRVLDIVQLPHVAGRLPRELSGGQQQRIALARCMVYGPSIILMDEPLGALDRKLRDRMQLEIKELHSRLGITVLYVTHDQEEAMAMSDRICLMNNGRIEQIGSPRELYFRPDTPFVADFLGESNIIDGELVEPGEIAGIRTRGGLSIRARTGQAVARGESVKVIIRPESLRLLRDCEKADNVAAGRITETVFVGGVSRFFVTLADGIVVSAKQLTDSTAPSPQVGDEVHLGWSAEHGVVLKAAESSR